MNATLTSTPTEPGVEIVTITVEGMVRDMTLIRERAERMVAARADAVHTCDVVQWGHHITGDTITYKARLVRRFDSIAAALGHDR